MNVDRFRESAVHHVENHGRSLHNFRTHIADLTVALTAMASLDHLRTNNSPIVLSLSIFKLNTHRNTIQFQLSHSTFAYRKQLITKVKELYTSVLLIAGSIDHR